MVNHNLSSLLSNITTSEYCSLQAQSCDHSNGKTWILKTHHHDSVSYSSHRFGLFRCCHSFSDPDAEHLEKLLTFCPGWGASEECLLSWGYFGDVMQFTKFKQFIRFIEMYPIHPIAKSFCLLPKAAKIFQNYV